MPDNFFGHVMKREKLEHFVTTDIIERKRIRGKQQKTMLTGLTKWLKVGRVMDTLDESQDRDAWKVMITYTKEQGT